MSRTVRDTSDPNRRVTVNVRELVDELATLDPDQPVPAELILAFLDADLSYIEDALSQWLVTAEMHGRTCQPEVEAFCEQLRAVL